MLHTVMEILQFPYPSFDGIETAFRTLAVIPGGNVLSSRTLQYAMVNWGGNSPMPSAHLCEISTLLAADVEQLVLMPIAPKLHVRSLGLVL